MRSTNAMRLPIEPYVDQTERLPCSGRHILAHFDEDAIVVYQAFRPAIGRWAAEHGRFGGEFSLARMSWIKTSFLWMMYRSGWATKPGQEVVLAVWLRRAGFEAILAEAVSSTFDSVCYGDQAAWSAAVARSTVRLQWDPDRTPKGEALGRRAIQLGLRGQTLAHYATKWIMHIEDITGFVHEQAALISSPEGSRELLTPHAAVYRPASEQTVTRLGLSPTARPFEEN